MSKQSEKNSLTLSSNTSKRITEELREITNDPPDGCSAGPKGDNLLEWVCTIMGPCDTPYEGGMFSLDVDFPQNYPFNPPRCTDCCELKVKFRTRIYHCNVSSKGEVCLDILKDRWSPVLTISKLLLSISSLLTDCNPDDPLAPEIAALYRANKKLHDKNARAWTNRHALPD